LESGAAVSEKPSYSYRLWLKKTFGRMEACLDHRVSGIENVPPACCRVNAPKTAKIRRMQMLEESAEMF